MNQNDNNNGYEVMDSGGMYHQPRYPYAKAPGAEFQQMNYKDWMNSYVPEGQDRINMIQAAIDANTALTATFGVAWAVLGVSNPVASAVAGILNVVTPIIFNEVDPNSPLKVWESMIGYAQALIKKELTETVRNLALDHIDRINDYQIDYKNKARIWETNPSPGNANLLRTAFNNLKNSCQDAMPHLDTRGYEAILLPLYAQAANIHLIVLRDGIMHGKSWGMSDEEYEDLKSGYFGFHNRIATYTNYCTNTFDAGVNADYVADLEDCAKYPWSRYNQDPFYSGFFGPGNTCKGSTIEYNQPPIENMCAENEFIAPQNGTNQPFQASSRMSRGEYSNVEAWNLRNEFMSSMIIQVLDTVALWPTYDPERYPSAVKSELTREIYTDIRGTTYRSDSNENTLSAITNRMIRKPHLFEWPNMMTFFVDNVNVRYTWVGNSWTKGQVLIGIKTESTRTLDSITRTNRQGLTDEYEYNHMLLDVSTSQKDITSIRTKQWFEPREFAFYRWGDYPSYPDLGFGTIQEDIPGYSVYQVNDYIYTPSIRENTFPPIEVPNGSPQPSHRLSWMKFEPVRQNATEFIDSKQIGATIFGWTHTSVDSNNTVGLNKITQIPAVKASRGTDYEVIAGPGSTGGDLVSLVPTYAEIEIPLTVSGPKGYRVRIRYATKEQKRVRTGIFLNGNWRYDERALARTYSTGSLSYNTFGYGLIADVNIPTGTTMMKLSIMRQDPFSEPLIIDKIEFIPLLGTVEEYQAQEALEKAEKAVNTLFTNNGKNALKLNVTDYQVDQAARLVECMSDEIYPKEKMCLLDHVKCAKRLSQVRNLLNHGDFESPDWSGADGWSTSNQVSIESDNPIFKGRYLKLPGANQPQFSDQIFPTYAYQKIEESRLKPYTRYRVRGLIGNSTDLEVFVTRYEKEVHKKLHVPNDIIPSNPCTGEYPLEQGSYPVVTNQAIPQNMSCGPCDDGSQMMMQQTSMVCVDPHQWECHIDTGELDMNQNLGIWVGFKIGTTDGMATLDNLEVVEEGPLTGEALARMKKREHKWKQKGNEKRMKIEKAVQGARGAVQSLFTNVDQNQLQPSITLNEILRAETWVQKIPYVYHPFLEGALPTVPGEAYNIFQQLTGAIATARALYEQRNVLRNGDFDAGLSNWNGTEGAKVQQIGNASVLVISDWSTNVSQEVCVHPEHGYVLRVTAKKEGSGEGYVKISDGTKENTETLKFIAGEGTTSTTSPMMPPRESYYEQNMTDYPSQNTGNRADVNGNPMSYQSESFGINPYGDEYMMNASSPYAGTDCGCGCRTNAYTGGYPTMSDASNGYERNAYPGSINQTNPMTSSCGCGCHTKTYGSEMNIATYPSESLSGYVTKTVEIFPETNRICIEIGATSGTFMVESVELIRMGCE
ncbi:insecticidal delta-endotoxin Cry8Ea1 family protein [Bacillus thuringiensis]|uniref:insecticidal delta-endotoxin Cry8Ea1 family protein n=1 Tax=Bacillus thuringiensis TaxID=1428 RepID=UPI003338F556